MEFAARLCDVKFTSSSTLRNRAVCIENLSGPLRLSISDSAGLSERLHTHRSLAEITVSGSPGLPGTDNRRGPVSSSLDKQCILQLWINLWSQLLFCARKPTKLELPVALFLKTLVANLFYFLRKNKLAPTCSVPRIVCDHLKALRQNQLIHGLLKKWRVPSTSIDRPWPFLPGAQLAQGTERVNDFSACCIWEDEACQWSRQVDSAVILTTAPLSR